MKKKEVQIGATYTCKVSGKVQSVRVVRENPHGGWDCINDRTGRGVHVRGAQRFRKLVCAPIPSSKPQNILQQAAADARRVNEEFELDQLDAQRAGTVV